MAVHCTRNRNADSAYSQRFWPFGLPVRRVFNGLYFDCVLDFGSYCVCGFFGAHFIDNIVFYIIGIPFKNISIQSLNKIEAAAKPAFHLFALAKEQVSVSYDNNRAVNLSLYKNDEFICRVNQLKASKCLNQQGEPPSMLTVRFVIVLVYMAVNLLVLSGIFGAWFYSPYFLIMMSAANIICLAFYPRTIQHGGR